MLRPPLTLQPARLGVWVLPRRTASSRCMLTTRPLSTGHMGGVLQVLSTHLRQAYSNTTGAIKWLLMNNQQQECFQILRCHCAFYAGLEQLKAQQAGAALRHLGDAKDLLVAAQTASRAYDRAEPVTSAVEHEYADLKLKDAIEKPFARVSNPCIAYFACQNFVQQTAARTYFWSLGLKCLIG